MKKQNIIFALLFMMLVTATSAFAVSNSPFEIMTSVGIDQAQKNLIPSLIIWIFILSAVTAGLMRQMMPLVIGGVACFVIAFIPDIATSFNNFDFLNSTDATLSVTN